MYQFLNYFLFIFHAVFVLFNLTGWWFKKTRRLNLITLSVTAGSWFVLGIWFGWGYCLCTDVHWMVRRELGYNDQSRSYIHFLILKTTGANLNQRLVGLCTLIGFLASIVMSVLLNIIDWRRRRKALRAESGVQPQRSS